MFLCISYTHLSYLIDHLPDHLVREQEEQQQHDDGGEPLMSLSKNDILINLKNTRKKTKCECFLNLLKKNKISRGYNKTDKPKN